MNTLFHSIKGSHNVITGCNSGLGLATLKWFLKRGSGPILGIDNRINNNLLESLEIDEEQKSRLLLKEHNTFDVEKVESSLSDFVQKHGIIDNLLNIAGAALAFGLNPKIEEGDTINLDGSHDLTNFNITGTFNMIRSVTKYMVEDWTKKELEVMRPKCIVNVSSTASNNPQPAQAFYAATSGAIESMTLCVARELSPYNIRCNTIKVGFFDTPLLRGSDERIVDFVGEVGNLCPNRIGHPDEFAHLVESIIQNQMINGACIKLDAAAQHPFS